MLEWLFKKIYIQLYAFNRPWQVFVNKLLLFQMRALREKTSRRISAAKNSVWYLWWSLQNNNWTQIILNKTSSLIWIPNIWHCNDRTSGANQDSMLGAQYWKHKVFSFERRRREAMLGGGGSGGMLPRKWFEKNIYDLVHSRAHLSL